jgi:NAD(P)-dependent dehydrogenase (short-subunit alcohol dehydrogenase family)
MSKVWLITGCSSGFGREIVLAALARGDIVVATARDPSKLKDLADRGALTGRLDVVSDDATLRNTIEKIVAKTGRIDILVNNAGYILAGGVEECSRQEVLAQFQTNVFGQLNVLRAVLPTMRAARGGVVANLGSIGGWRGTPAAGMYCATKACASVVAESLRAEVAHLGIQVTSIEPGYFRTNFLNPGNKTVAKKAINDIKPGVDPTHQSLKSYDRRQPGDPKKGAQLIVEALTGTGRCQGRKLPPRLVLGKDAYQTVSGCLDANRASLEQWKALTTTTDCDPHP